MYAQGRTIGHIVNVPTIIPLNESRSQPRFPAVEAVMGAERKFQETWVEVQEGPMTGRYFVASYYDRRCPVNVALKRLLPDVDWRGELFVMRGGQAVFVTDLGSRRAAERAVRKCVSSSLRIMRRSKPFSF